MPMKIPKSIPSDGPFRSGDVVVDTDGFGHLVLRLTPHGLKIFMFDAALLPVHAVMIEHQKISELIDVLEDIEEQQEQDEQQS